MKNKFLVKIKPSKKEGELIVIKNHGFSLNGIDNSLIYINRKNDEAQGLDGSSENEFIGIRFELKSGHIKVSSDIFGSIPMYFLQDKEGDFLLSNDIDLLVKSKNVSLECDLSGCNQFIIFGHTIYDRTIYKKIKQFPPAANVVFTRDSYSVEKYDKSFLFESVLPRNEVSICDLGAQISSILKKTFYDKLNDHDNGKQVLFGLSGGLDSRLTLSLLHDLGMSNKLALFTYGFDINILEAQTAKKLAGYVGAPWNFYELTDKKYLGAYEDIIPNTHCSTSTAHAHILNYLSDHPESSMLSTYFTDALFGYATDEHKRYDTLYDCDYFSVLEHFRKSLSPDVYHCTYHDIEKALSTYNPNMNVSSVNEYKYIFERTPKFHIALMNEQSKLSENIINPFCNIELLKLLLSIPVEYRYDKKILKQIILEINPHFLSNNFSDTSNQAVYFRKDFKTILKSIASNFGSVVLLMVRGINALLFKLLGPDHLLFDKRATELHSSVLHRSFSSYLSDSLKRLETNGIITPGLSSELAVIRSFGNSNLMRFHALDLDRAMRK